MRAPWSWTCVPGLCGGRNVTAQPPCTLMVMLTVTQSTKQTLGNHAASNWFASLNFAPTTALNRQSQCQSIRTTRLVFSLYTCVSSHTRTVCLRLVSGNARLCV